MMTCPVPNERGIEMKLAIVSIVAVFAIWVVYMACRSLVATATEMQDQSTTAYQSATE